MSVLSIGNSDISPPSIKGQPVNVSWEGRKISYPIQQEDKDTLAKTKDKAIAVIKEEGIRENSPEQVKASTELAKSKIPSGFTQEEIKEKPTVEVKVQVPAPKKPEEEGESYPVELIKKESELIPESTPELPPTPPSTTEEAKTEKAGETVEEQAPPSEEDEEAQMYDQAEEPEAGKTEETKTEETEESKEPKKAEEAKQGEKAEKPEEAQKKAPTGETPSVLGTRGKELVGSASPMYKNMHLNFLQMRAVIESLRKENLELENLLSPQKERVEGIYKEAEKWTQAEGDQFTFVMGEGKGVIVSDEPPQYDTTLEDARKHLSEEQYNQYTSLCKAGNVGWISKKEHSQMKKDAQEYATAFLIDLKHEIDEQKKLRTQPEKKEEAPKRPTSYQPRKEAREIKEKVIPKEIKEAAKKTVVSKAIEEKQAEKRHERKEEEKLKEESDDIRRQAWKKEDLKRDIKKEEEKKNEG